MTDNESSATIRQLGQGSIKKTKSCLQIDSKESSGYNHYGI